MVLGVAKNFGIDTSRAANVSAMPLTTWLIPEPRARYFAPYPSSL